MRIVSEAGFAERIKTVLRDPKFDDVGCVTGPGRSGAVAAVYASHILGVSFIPFGQKPPIELGRVLVIDTARETGRTMRKAESKYAAHDPISVVVFEEPPRVGFWYEAPKPQRYRHEKKLTVVKYDAEGCRRFEMVFPLIGKPELVEE